MTLLDDNTLTPSVTRPAAPRSTPSLLPRVGIAAAVGVGVTAVALALPDVTGGHPMPTMTHYMGLLAANQPWNLLLFMAVPVILAETLAITELVMLFRSPVKPPAIHALNRWAGLLAGPWFLGITVYLMKNAVVPLTSTGTWHGLADYIAVGAYLCGLIPLLGIFLIELGILGRGSDRGRLKLHATFVGIFLVVAHVAMIFGMLDPTLVGWTPAQVTPVELPGPAEMPGM